MQFNSIGRSSDFSRAGKAAADDLVRIHAANRANAPDMGKIVENAATRRSKEKIAATKAQTEVARVGITTQANVKSDRIVQTAERGRDKAKRKAGALATAGKLFGTAGSYLGEKRTKREVGSEDSWYDKQISSAQDSYIKYSELLNDDGTLKSKPGSSTGDTGSSNTGGTASSSVSTTGGGGTTTTTTNNTSGASDGWARLSKVIRYAEGTSGDKGYNTQFTGTQFTDMSKHPRQIRSSGRYSSDAAGAYQFLSTTWDGAAKALNLTDFSPESQEKAGRYLTQQRKVNPDQVFTTIEEFKGAMDKLAPEWASLPYSGVSPSGHGNGSSYYGQGGKSLQELWKIYNGG